MVDQILLLILGTVIAIVGYFIKSLFVAMQGLLKQMEVQTEINRQVQKELKDLNASVSDIREQQWKTQIDVSVLKDKNEK